MFVEFAEYAIEQIIEHCPPLKLMIMSVHFHKNIIAQISYAYFMY